MSFGYAPPGLLLKGAPLEETIWADSDSLVASWEDEGGATSNIYQSVDSESDADYATLQNVIVNSGSATIRFSLENPSGQPSPSQTVRALIRCEWIDVLGAANPSSVTVIVRIKEGTTTVRAASSAQSISETPTDKFETMTTTEINSVTDWDNLYIEATFDVSGIDVDEEVNFRVYEARLDFIA